MNEIELKARIENENQLKEIINSFAKYEKTVTKDDTYYVNPSGNGKKIRIRKETENQKTTWLLTYKIKENKISPNGNETEVNKELETKIEDAFPLISYFKDCGWIIDLIKHKEVIVWTYDNATLELCYIPKLGWFLEIEILTKDHDDITIQNAQKKLIEILYKCKLSEKNIENKYYSQLLKEISK